MTFILKSNMLHMILDYTFTLSKLFEMYTNHGCNMNTKPGFGSTNDSSAVGLLKAAGMQSGGDRRSMRASPRFASGNAVRRTVPGGAGSGRHKGVPAAARGGAARRRDISGQKATINFLQLLCLLPLLWCSHRCHSCGLG